MLSRSKSATTLKIGVLEGLFDNGARAACCVARRRGICSLGRANVVDDGSSLSLSLRNPQSSLFQFLYHSRCTGNTTSKHRSPPLFRLPTSISSCPVYTLLCALTAFSIYVQEAIDSSVLNTARNPRDDHADFEGASSTDWIIGTKLVTTRTI